MNYQLPNGKVVYLSIDEYLSLTDEDIQYLIACDYGDVITNPFSGSAVDTKKKPEETEPREFLDNLDDEDFPNLDINISDLS
tara:strand:- start:1519 stop:1764 length:246 start_codon:yes stop_codon:yes gene_type:complete